MGWGWDITNFVWWVGIGHAGTLISAILLLFRQGWRTGVNRAAEAMTIFAVICAAQFPVFHMGRIYHQVTEDICRPIEAKPGKLWYIGFVISVLLLLFGVYSVYREVTYGTGEWNLNKTVGWGWDITNFVWWIGIGHAGTLISAILFIIQARLENRC